MRKNIAITMLSVLGIAVWLLGSGNVKASDLDRDPMEGGRMSPMESTQEYVGEDLLRSGSNDYISVTGVKGGIDVSKWQGNIDWNAVRASGVEYAFIRVGYRGMDQGILADDPYYKQNIEQATAAGVKVGVYVFSQAVSTAEAEEEADYIVSRIRNYNITMPVVIDYEFGNGMTGRLANAHLSKQAGTDVCKAFCARVENYGYTGMVYANKNMFTNYIDGPQIANQYLIWLAQYNSRVTYTGNYNFWQYCSDGSVSGINGNVDMNYWFIKDGVEDFSVEGLYYNATIGWAYYKNGSVETSFTGVAYNQYGKWYVKNGLLDTTYTGAACAKDGTWYYVVQGQVDENYTGMVDGGNSVWYYAKNGTIDLSYTGMAQNEMGWWYYVNGILDWHYTGMAENDQGWWYYSDGNINWNYTGLGSNEVGTWYYKDGRIDWQCKGLEKVNGVWWKINGGRVETEYNDLYASANLGWILVRNGQVDLTYTDLYNSPTYGWWKVKKGCVDFSYADLYESPTYGWWKIQNGAVDFGYTGQYNSSTYGNWKVKNGSVVF